MVPLLLTVMPLNEMIRFILKAMISSGVPRQRSEGGILLAVKTDKHHDVDVILSDARRVIDEEIMGLETLRDPVARRERRSRGGGGV
jgi:hypothetical protein